MNGRIRLSMALTATILFSLFLEIGPLACSCNWMGPFLKVSCGAPLVIHGKIRSRSEEKQGNIPSMEVEIIDVLQGGFPGSSLRVWGDNGMLCRADIRRFPVGSEWLLALDGPGSKPEMTPDHALSICGEFWLRVHQGKVIGHIDSEKDQAAVQEMPLAQFRQRFKNKVCRDSLRFIGEVNAGKSFLRYFGSHYTFHLNPGPQGWLISITDERGTEDLSRLTPPFHFTPNPREIEGWHFRNADNTGPNQPGDKNVNAPGEVREFVFSPEVGKTIDGPVAGRKPTDEELTRVSRYGQGKFTILEYRLKDLEPGKQAGFDWMRFQVEISWLQPTPGRE